MILKIRSLNLYLYNEFSNILHENVYYFIFIIIIHLNTKLGYFVPSLNILNYSIEIREITEEYLIKACKYINIIPIHSWFIELQLKLL